MKAKAVGGGSCSWPSSTLFALAPFVGALVAILLGDRSLGIVMVIAALIFIAGVALHLTERHRHQHCHDEHCHDHAHSHDDGHHDHNHDHEAPQLAPMPIRTSTTPAPTRMRTGRTRIMGTVTDDPTESLLLTIVGPGYTIHDLRAANQSSPGLDFLDW